MKEIQLGELYVNKGGSLNPSKFPDETFEYYSIPAYDTGEPAITRGSEIGSSKKIFQPNDIILSRIVPHIRRCWVVNSNKGLRQIGSGEWITFRSDEVDSSFLRFYLMSNEFNAKFMKTIKGVGGSLMRADPKQVAKFKIPLPPLPQQKKIAAILDAADAYRQKTKALIGKYEELSQSLFLDMFGDSWLNPKRIAQMNLLDVCDQIIDCPHSTPNYVKDISEYPCIRTTELVNGTINWSKMKYLDFDGYIIRTKRLKPEEGDIIYGREGTYGEAVIVPPKVKVSLGQRVMLFRPNYSMVNSLYLHAVLRSKGVYHQALRVNTGSTVGRVNVKDIKRFKLMIPPITLQNQFATRIQAIEAQKAQAQASLAQADDLFNSLLQKAFKGGLGNKI